MNIFILSKDPHLAAQMQCDKHVVKMVLETAQLLCSAFPQGTAPYKRSHYNHPSATWIRESKQNYEWLITHGLALCDEYQFRYGKTHKSKEVILWCQKHYAKLKLPNIGLTAFKQVVKDNCLSPNAVSAYRKYYLQEKRAIAKWTKRAPPRWWK
jgi:hypothetical protein